MGEGSRDGSGESYRQRRMSLHIPLNALAEKIGLQLLLAQNHPSLRAYRHHLTLLSANLSLWHHNFKYSKALLRRLVQSFLPGDPCGVVYGTWLSLINQLASPPPPPSTSTPARADRNDDTPTKARPSPSTESLAAARMRDIHAALSALTSLHALAEANKHDEICLLADVIRLRIIFARDSDRSSREGEEEGEVEKTLGVCERGLALEFDGPSPAAGPAASTPENTNTDPSPTASTPVPETPLLTSLRLQTLTLGVLLHTHAGRAAAAATRLARLHAMCDAGAVDSSDAGEGRVEVLLSAKPGGEGAEKMWVSVPHPRCMLLLTYLGVFLVL